MLGRVSWAASRWVRSPTGPRRVGTCIDSTPLIAKRDGAGDGRRGVGGPMRRRRGGAEAILPSSADKPEYTADDEALSPARWDAVGRRDARRRWGGRRDACAGPAWAGPAWAGPGWIQSKRGRPGGRPILGHGSGDTRRELGRVGRAARCWAGGARLRGAGPGELGGERLGRGTGRSLCARPGPARHGPAR